MTFDAQAYWAGREFKKYVVTLFCGKGRKARHDVKHVSARTAEGAIRTARDNSCLPEHAQAYAQLATPFDLGCREVAP